MGTIFVPRGLSAKAFTLRYTDSTHELNSSGRGRRPLERNKTAHVVHQIDHANLHCARTMPMVRTKMPPMAFS